MNIYIDTSKKDISGTYKVISQSCGFGGEDVLIDHGPPSSFKNVLGVNVAKSESNLYSLDLMGKKTVLIPTKNNHLIAIDEKGKIICGGQVMFEKMYLYCQSATSQTGTVGTGGYCRTSLSRQ